MDSKTKWIIASAIAAVVLATSGLVAYFHFSVPDPAKMSGEQIAKYVKSEDFNSLSRQQRGEFFHQAMDSRVNTYFSTPPEERTKYLDKIIDEMGSMRRQGPPPGMRDRRPDANGFRERFQNAKPSERRAMQESSDPEQRARQRMFFQAMRTRMQQRGMQMPRFGPGGGGGPR